MDVQFIYGRLDLQKLNGIDAIVCPTDVYCSGSGGLDQKIHQAAGPMLKFALKDASLSDGDVFVTGAFNLDTGYIFHAAVPKNVNPAVQNPALLFCYRNILMELGKTDVPGRHLTTAAITLLGTGSCGWSYKQSLDGLWHSILDYHRAYQGRGALEKLFIYCPGDIPISLTFPYMHRASRAFFDRPMKWDPCLDPGLWYDLMYRFDVAAAEGISLIDFIKEIQRYFRDATGQWLCGDTNVRRTNPYTKGYEWNVTPSFAAIAVPVLCHNLCKLDFRSRNDFPDFLLPVTLDGQQMMLPYDILPELAQLRKKSCDLTEYKRILLDSELPCFLTTCHYRNTPDVVAYYLLDLEEDADAHYKISPSTAHTFCAFLHCPSGDLDVAISKCMKENGAAFAISFLKKLGAEPCHRDSV